MDSVLNGVKAAIKDNGIYVQSAESKESFTPLAKMFCTL